ncbi:TPA: hypothetical protein ACMDP5_003517 [Vibrio cholerae]|nr:hypothetical protein [Vibrio cholerae]HDZ9325902.1 hypothetical protein [Vibrio cholerae]
MQFKISPSFEHSKVENANISDLIDVFSDLWEGYVFAPVSALLKLQNGEVAAMSVLCSYFEAIESYYTGESSNGRSKEFFKLGFSRVFVSDNEGLDVVAGHFYSHVRCGLAHEGLLSYRVCYSAQGAKPIFATYPKAEDGSLKFKDGIESLVINPQLIFKCVKMHFDKYVSDLRDLSPDIIQPFEKTIRRQLKTSTQTELVVTLTESEFLGQA